MSQLKARHDGYQSSHFDYQRKKLLSQLAEDERAKYQSRGEKPPSDASLDKFAHAHAQYARFLDDGLAERRELERLRAKLDQMHGELETALAVVTYYDKELRINEEVIRFARGEQANTH
jgi:multidrug resistance efflux pump